jgi:hypothetical protein
MKDIISAGFTILVLIFLVTNSVFTLQAAQISGCCCEFSTSVPEVAKYNEEGHRLVLEAVNRKFAYYRVFVLERIFTSLVFKA